MYNEDWILPFLLFIEDNGFQIEFYGFFIIVSISSVK